MGPKAKLMICATFAAFCLAALAAQEPAPAGRGGRGGRQGTPPQTYWVQKTKGGVYVPPNKPLTRLADLKKKHAGQANWKETVVKDLELQAEYNSSAPGTKLSPRFHAGFSNIMVVIEGEMRWEIENQTPFVATRGSIVNIAPMTIYSYEVVGSRPALWVDVNPTHVDTVYQNTPPTVPGAVVTKVSFNRQPAKYVEPNMPHWNLFESAKARPEAPGGARVRTDHFYANANYGFADPNDPLNPNRGNPGGRGGRGAAPTGPFDPGTLWSPPCGLGGMVDCHGGTDLRPVRNRRGRGKRGRHPLRSALHLASNGISRARPILQVDVRRVRSG